MKLSKVLLSVMLVSVVGCGSRKATTQIGKVSISDKSELTITGSTSTLNTSSGSNETSEQVSKTDEKQETRTRELYDENGKLKERITELINSKSADNSKRSNKSSYEITTTVKMVITKTKLRTLNIHTKDKQKSTTTNRNGLYYLLGALVIVGLAFWLKPWKR